MVYRSCVLMENEILINFHEIYSKIKRTVNGFYSKREYFY